MKIQERYAQVSDASVIRDDGCDHAELRTIIDDGWQMIQCPHCLKRWDSLRGRRREKLPASIDDADGETHALQRYERVTPEGETASKLKVHVMTIAETCTECRKSLREVKQLFGLKGGTYVCDECITLMREIVSEPRPVCTDHTPSWFVGRWRDWHRGHGCDQDDGKPRAEAAKTEIAQHAKNESTGFLTDAELGFLRASTTSGNTMLVRALDELAARRRAIEELRTADPSDLHPDPDKREIARTCQLRILGRLQHNLDGAS